MPSVKRMALFKAYPVMKITSQRHSSAFLVLIGKFVAYGKFEILLSLVWNMIRTQADGQSDAKTVGQTD